MPRGMALSGRPALLDEERKQRASHRSKRSEEHRKAVREMARRYGHVREETLVHDDDATGSHIFHYEVTFSGN